MIHPIYLYGESVLRDISKPILKDELDVDFINDMIETMHNSRGIGLAAPQINVSKRLFTVDVMVSETERFNKIFINPRIVNESGMLGYYQEGCLSIPNVHANVLRHNKVTLEWFDENWKQHLDTFDGIAARVIQHEYDHLEGILFLDKINVRKILLLHELRKIKNRKIMTRYPSI